MNKKTKSNKMLNFKNGGHSKIKTSIYGLSLLFIAILVSFLYIILRDNISDQKTHAARVNISGRQRMLSQRIALYSLDYVNVSTEAEREQIREELFKSADLMEKSHDGLINNDPGMQLSGMLSKQTSEMYFGETFFVDTHTRRYVAEAKKLLKITNPSADDPHLKYILSNATTLLVKLDILVKQYQIESEVDNSNLLYLQTAGVTTILALLMVIELFIFVPMNRQLRQSFREIEQFNEKLRKLDKLKTRFITALSHVTRTPLNKIRWALETLLVGDFGSITKEQSTLIQQALKSEDTILRLIFNMNITIDIERGTLTIAPTPTSLASLTESVLETFADQCSIQNIKCDLSLSSKKLPLVAIDAGKLRTVIENLFENAVRYTKKGGKISVKISKKKNVLVLKISDTGVGIPAPEQSLLFERFFRASNASKMYPDGVGLGLYIAKAIILAHGGKIGFKSVKNSGSTFWFEIPLTSK